MTSLDVRVHSGNTESFPLEMIVKTYILRATHATQLPRNLSQQFQDCTQFGQSFLVVFPHALRAGLPIAGWSLGVQSSSHSTP